ncbi:hypothetical protein [Devosia equisanguinis]|uniref:hypothetical protein n=1 Tax=Devosia equisanguinis TaxID=2490941 RepID=UPI000F7E0FAF|nr:hypothetical protein [Devosia equisanguinis]
MTKLALIAGTVPQAIVSISFADVGNFGIKRQHPMCGDAVCTCTKAILDSDCKPGLPATIGTEKVQRRPHINGN